jgi:hypothetical protein
MDVALIKLITGEDIIAEVEFYEHHVDCYDPFSLAMHPEKGLVLMKFSPYAKTEQVKFDRTSILCILHPQDALVNHYKELTSKIITPKQGIIV